MPKLEVGVTASGRLGELPERLQMLFDGRIGLIEDEEEDVWAWRCGFYTSM